MTEKKLSFCLMMILWTVAMLLTNQCLNIMSYLHQKWVI